jgi:hypothetical protein
MQWSFVTLPVPPVATTAPIHQETKLERGEIKKMKN